MRRWIGRVVRRILLVVFVLLVVLPVTLTLAYRFLPPPITPHVAATWMAKAISR